ncbi:Phosphatidylinositol/phosphatidylcholine transfer protein SFH3 [Linum perenne]
MGMGSQDAIDQLGSLMDQVDEPLKRTYQNVHQGYQVETLARFLRARDWNVPKAHKMLIDSLHWRVQNEIDSILAKPIVPADLYRSVRDSQLIGMSGYSREGLPVFAMGVGLSTFDKASLMTVISTVDDLNYPEKTNTYYIVNAPYIFSACWKVVKPLLQERTRKKVQVLHGNGRDELLKIMDISSLPHFCKREGSGSSKHLDKSSESCYSLDHPFHQQLYNHIKQQASINASTALIKQGSFHVNVPESAAEGNEIAKNIESEIHRRENGIPRGLSGSLDDLKIKDDSE